MTELNHETRSVRLDTPHQIFQMERHIGVRTNECIVYYKPLECNNEKKKKIPNESFLLSLPLSSSSSSSLAILHPFRNFSNSVIYSNLVKSHPSPRIHNTEKKNNLQCTHHPSDPTQLYQILFPFLQPLPEPSPPLPPKENPIYISTPPFPLPTFPLPRNQIPYLSYHQKPSTIQTWKEKSQTWYCYQLTKAKGYWAKIDCIKLEIMAHYSMYSIRVCDCEDAGKGEGKPARMIIISSRI